MRRRTLVLLVTALLAGCGGDDAKEADADGNPTSEPSATAGPTFARARVVIETDTRAVRVPVEVAENDEQRQFGLMFRQALPPNAGMVFVFEGDTTGGFWMKNTLIPLSIAFFGGRGQILAILDMEPCRSNPCPLYDPGVAYRGALEVNKGAFERWGVEKGDRIRLER